MNSTEDAYNKQVESTAKDELASRILYNAIAQAEKPRRFQIKIIRQN